MGYFLLQCTGPLQEHGALGIKMLHWIQVRHVYQRNGTLARAGLSLGYCVDLLYNRNIMKCEA